MSPCQRPSTSLGTNGIGGRVNANSASQTDIVPDSEQRGLIGALPAAIRPYASLIRLDRPIGAWLLFWPGAWSVALAGMGERGWWLIAWLALGAWAMRSAGCVYNDIIDRDLDRQVERTRLRPLASKRASLKGAWALLVAMSLIGLVVLLQLSRTAQIVALISLAPVALYPFMKRVTWWPQAWLGLTFNWGALLGFAAQTGRLDVGDAMLYAGLIFWTLGYDTIYAHQDKEDDELIGVKSTARLFGDDSRKWILRFYAIAFTLILASGFTEHTGWPFAFAMLAAGAHMLWQVKRLDVNSPDNCLYLFRSNRETGALIALALLLASWLG